MVPPAVQEREAAEAQVGIRFRVQFRCKWSLDLNPLTQFLSTLGSLNWSRAVNGPTASPSSVTYNFTLAVPYGRVYGAASATIKHLAPFTCQAINTLESSSPQSYNPGEIPCGRVIDGSWKELVSIPVNTISGSWDGITYQINPLILPVDISRGANEGIYQVQSLDTKSQVSRTSSTVFGEDISVMYTPSGNSAAMELCLNIPGVEVTSNPQNVSVDAWKKILGVKISYGTSFTITPGQASYDYGRACFAIDYNWPGSNSAPTVSLSTTQAPTLSNLSYQGFTIST